MVMTRRLLILGAGTGASNNLLRSLRAGDPSLFLVGCHHDRFVLKKSTADRNYVVPTSDRAGFASTLRRVIEREKIELVVPNSDADVSAVSRLRNQIPCRLFLPKRRTIELCQDKYKLAVFLRARGVPAPLTYPITDPDDVEELFRELAPRSRLWCRMRSGSGSMGAIPVRRPEQVRSWVSYWSEMRGVAATSFTLSEYLPGRDFACQSLWKDGVLVMLKMCERLSYFGGASSPSGASSTPALGKVVFEPRAAEVCVEAVRAVEERASGVFSIDLKEDVGGVPCVTEVNAGRFFMITNIFDLTGKHNMALTYVRVAFDEPVEIREEYDFAEDYYLVRDLDTTPGIFRAEEFFEGIEDARR